MGGNTTVKYARRIQAGKTLTLGRNVLINALSRIGIEFGDNVTILDNTIIECTGVIRELGEGLKVGNDVGFAQNCFIQVRGKVEIKDYVIFGPGVSLFSENHIYKDPEIPILMQGEKRIGISIGEGSWIAGNATILDGVTIGKNCIVAAGSVVNKDVPDYTIVGGIPARVIKKRKE